MFFVRRVSVSSTAQWLGSFGGISGNSAVPGSFFCFQLRDSHSLCVWCQESQVVPIMLLNSRRQIFRVTGDETKGLPGEEFVGISSGFPLFDVFCFDFLGV